MLLSLLIARDDAVRVGHSANEQENHLFSVFDVLYLGSVCTVYSFIYLFSPLFDLVFIIQALDDCKTSLPP